MKLNLLNTVQGLKPLYDDDFDEKKKLKIGEVYTAEIAAGWYEPIYSIERKEWIHAPRSISFEKMGQDEFNDLYSNVKRVLFNTFLRNITEEEFMRNMINY